MYKHAAHPADAHLTRAAARAFLAHTEQIEERRPLLHLLAACAGCRAGTGALVRVLEERRVRLDASVDDAIAALAEARWDLFLPVVILAGIFGGFMTLGWAAKDAGLRSVGVEEIRRRAMAAGILGTTLRANGRPVEIVGIIVFTVAGIIDLANHVVERQVPVVQLPEHHRQLELCQQPVELEQRHVAPGAGGVASISRRYQSMRSLNSSTSVKLLML